jgi:antitoxin component HigA of HigAB toxin-antitoxin module
VIAVPVEEYERYDPGHADALKYRMEDRGQRQRDQVMPVFGSSSVASDVLNG